VTSKGSSHDDVGVERPWCGDLDRSRLGESVELAVGSGGGEISRPGLVDLRDRSGVLQLVFETTWWRRQRLSPEDVIRSGVVRLRAKGRRTPTSPPARWRSGWSTRAADRGGHPAVRGRGLDQRLRGAATAIPVPRPAPARDDGVVGARHRVVAETRRYFDEMGFVEVETPISPSHPEGPATTWSRPGSTRARSTPCPIATALQAVCRSPGSVATCRSRAASATRTCAPTGNRSSPRSTSRHRSSPRRTSSPWSRVPRRVFRWLGLTCPTPARLAYREAMERFGSDRPDTRFGLELHDLSGRRPDAAFRSSSGRPQRDGSRARPTRRCRSVPQAARRPRRGGQAIRRRRLLWFKRTAEGVASPARNALETPGWSGSSRRPVRRRDYFCWLSAGARGGPGALGALRLHLARDTGLVAAGCHAFLWVTSSAPGLDGDAQRFVSCTPFTAPRRRTRICSPPTGSACQCLRCGDGRAGAGGGSIRIHRPDLQQRMSQLSHRRGRGASPVRLPARGVSLRCSAHGGIALGVDRMVMSWPGGLDPDVIAFPKTTPAAA